MLQRPCNMECCNVVAVLLFCDIYSLFVLFALISLCRYKKNNSITEFLRVYRCDQCIRYSHSVKNIAAMIDHFLS